MRNEWVNSFDRTNAVVAAGVWFAVLVVYLMTKAPTVTFWDCGEFIAVSHILGIPHPPGTPLYVMISRLFATLPLYADQAARINFLTVLCSSMTPVFAYLSGVRILRTWFVTDNSPYSRMLTYAGAASGALFLAFSATNWGNSVEAEVYGMSMLIFVSVLWLTLVYHETPDGLRADAIMLFVVYLAFLGIAIHPTTFLVLPIAALFFVVKKGAPRSVWFLAAVFIFFELFLVFALSSRPGEVPYFVPVTVVLILYLFYVFSCPTISRAALLMGIGLLGSAAPLVGVLSSAVIALTSGSGVPTEPPSVLLRWVGGISFVVTLALALYWSARYLLSRDQRGEEQQHTFVPSLFVIGAGVMAAILLLDKLRGYTAFAVVSIAVLIIVGSVVRSHLRWPILIAMAGVSLVALAVRPFVLGIAASTAVVLVLGFYFKSETWKAALLIIVAAGVGYSVHLFVPIRSAQDPYINENAPSKSISAFVNYLERKQYGSQSMTSRMFTRRAEWENQFGDYRRMGFWHFFSNQYGLNGPKFFVLFVLGLLGLWEGIRIRSPYGLLLSLLILISSVGLVLYMNFADGTRQHPVTGADYIEVRDRDYFFTPAFLLFGLAIGLGISATLQYVRQTMLRLNNPIRGVILGVGLGLFLIPVYTVKANYFESDRSNNYLAYDYAWNLLQSADPNAVLITYGDNDTFPLWCLQEAFGVRKDVRNVNLSLANTKWYIKQVRDYMKLDLGWNDQQIDSLRPYRSQDGRVFQIQDQVVDAIIDHNHGRFPINFSVTVADDGRKYHGQSARDRLVLSGLKWRFKEAADGMVAAVDESIQFLESDKFQMRGLDDPTVYKDENMTRLTSNYANAFMAIADSLSNAGRGADAERLMRRLHEKMPDNFDAISYLASLYANRGQVGPLTDLVAETRSGDTDWLRTLLGRVRRKAGNSSEAEAILSQVLGTRPSYRPAYEELIRLYSETRQMDKLGALFSAWLKSNPDDKQTQRILEDMKAGRYEQRPAETL